MKTKFFEYDVVRSIRPLGEDVPSGTSGAVLMVFASMHPQYEVEFVDCAGGTLAVLTVKEDDLEFVQRADCGNWSNPGKSGCSSLLSRAEGIGRKPKPSAL